MACRLTVTVCQREQRSLSLMCRIRTPYRQLGEAVAKIILEAIRGISRRVQANRWEVVW
jgi:hypothetical protein